MANAPSPALGSRPVVSQSMLTHSSGGAGSRIQLTSSRIASPSEAVRVNPGLRAGTSAWEAAGTIHTDIQKGFIRAEIIGWEDFSQAGGETQAKRAGKQRLETKTYVMQDYDVVNFRFNK